MTMRWEGSLTNLHGTLYGVTAQGDAHGRSTVYSLSGF